MIRTSKKLMEIREGDVNSTNLPQNRFRWNAICITQQLFRKERHPTEVKDGDGKQHADTRHRLQFPVHDLLVAFVDVGHLLACQIANFHEGQVLRRGLLLPELMEDGRRRRRRRAVAVIGGGGGQGGARLDGLGGEGVGAAEDGRDNED